MRKPEDYKFPVESPGKEGLIIRLDEAHITNFVSISIGKKSVSVHLKLLKNICVNLWEIVEFYKERHPFTTAIESCWHTIDAELPHEVWIDRVYSIPMSQFRTFSFKGEGNSRRYDFDTPQVNYAFRQVLETWSTLAGRQITAADVMALEKDERKIPGLGEEFEADFTRWLRQVCIKAVAMDKKALATMYR